MPRQNRRNQQIPWNVLLHDEQLPPEADDHYDMADVDAELVPRPAYAANINAEHPPDPPIPPILQLHGSDFPGMKLISFHLTGTNYLAWRRSMRIALGAKDKLVFIDGLYPMPAPESPEYNTWKRVDCMLIAWILNAISKEIARSFIYAKSARVLWDELAMRFGESNGSLVYQLKRDIITHIQGNQSVVVYYNKLHELWDELDQILPIPTGSNANNQLLLDFANTERLMQFLVGLNDSFDGIRSQILILDPLPLVNKAYSMVQRVEKQRQIQIAYPSESSVMLVQSTPTNSGSHGRQYAGASNISAGYAGFKPKLSKEEKALLKCTYCKGSGHDQAECFKLHGVPDWYKRLKENRNKASVHMVDAQYNSISSVPNSDVSGSDMGSMIQSEIAKYFSKQTPGCSTSYPTEFSGFAGPTD